MAKIQILFQNNLMTVSKFAQRFQKHKEKKKMVFALVLGGLQ